MSDCFDKQRMDGLAGLAKGRSNAPSRFGNGDTIESQKKSMNSNSYTDRRNSLIEIGNQKKENKIQQSRSGMRIHKSKQRALTKGESFIVLIYSESARNAPIESWERGYKKESKKHYTLH